MFNTCLPSGGPSCNPVCCQASCSARTSRAGLKAAADLTQVHGPDVVVAGDWVSGTVVHVVRSHRITKNTGHCLYTPEILKRRSDVLPGTHKVISSWLLCMDYGLPV